MVCVIPPTHRINDAQRQVLIATTNFRSRTHNVTGWTEMLGGGPKCLGVDRNAGEWTEMSGSGPKWLGVIRLSACTEAICKKKNAFRNFHGLLCLCQGNSRPASGWTKLKWSSQRIRATLSPTPIRSSIRTLYAWPKTTYPRHGPGLPFCKCPWLFY